MHDSTGNCFEFESNFFSNSCTAGLVRPSYEVSKGGKSRLEKQNGKWFSFSVHCQIKDEHDDDGDTDKHIQKYVCALLTIALTLNYCLICPFFHSCDMFCTQSDFNCPFGSAFILKPKEIRFTLRQTTNVIVI